LYPDVVELTVLRLLADFCWSVLDRKSSASFGPCFLAWLQVIYAAKLAA
jgi:hypothetical protein